MKKMVSAILVGLVAVVAFFAAERGLGLIAAACVVSAYTIGFARGAYLARMIHRDEQP